MKNRHRALIAVVFGLVGLVAASATPAQALSLHGDYFVLGGNHPDTERGIDGVVVTGLVNNSLAVGASPTKAANPPQSDITNAIGTQIQWWTASGGGTLGNLAANTGVTAAGSRTDTGTATSFLPTTFNTNLFAGAANFNSGATDGGANGYLTVHWTGSFHVVGTPQLTLRSDDDAWLFVRVHDATNTNPYTLLLDSGGVKGIGAQNNAFQQTILAANDYDFQLFWADRNTVQAGLTFTCTGDGSCSDLSAVPEPATLLLFGTTLVGLGSVVRRRLKGRNLGV
jgi:hypothetical protein